MQLKLTNSSNISLLETKRNFLKLTVFGTLGFLVPIGKVRSESLKSKLIRKIFSKKTLTIAGRSIPFLSGVIVVAEMAKYAYEVYEEMQVDISVDNKGEKKKKGGMKVTLKSSTGTEEYADAAEFEIPSETKNVYTISGIYSSNQGKHILVIETGDKIVQIDDIVVSRKTS